MEGERRRSVPSLLVHTHQNNMTLITQRDFETKAGQEKIAKTIHNLEARVHELDCLVHDCLKEEHQLESELAGGDEGAQHIK